jgi:hypothetical protein
MRALHGRITASSAAEPGWAPDDAYAMMSRRRLCTYALDQTGVYRRGDMAESFPLSELLREGSEECRVHPIHVAEDRGRHRKRTTLVTCTFGCSVASELHHDGSTRDSVRR